MHYFALNQQYVYFRNEYFGGIISDVRETNFHIVNSVAASFISNILRGNSYEETYLRLLDEYDIEPNILKADIETLCEEMIANHYISESMQPPIIDEESVLSTAFKEEKLVAPIEVNIYPHYDCNQSCDFCYVPRICVPDKMSICDYRRFIEDPGWRNVLSYNILGGEPFLKPDFLLDLIQIIPSNKKICISTNGSCYISPLTIQTLKGYPNVWIQVSLESYKEEEHDAIVHRQGAFKRSIDFLKILVKEKINVSVNTVVTSRNIYDIIPMAVYVKNLGVSLFSATLNFPGRNYDYTDYMEYRELFEKFILVQEQLHTLDDTDFSVITSYENIFCSPEEKRSVLEDAEVPHLFLRCQGGSVSIELTPSGDVYPCGSLLDEKSYTMGNVKHDSFGDIWDNNWHKIVDNFEEVNKACRTCHAVWGCYSGCPIVRSNVRKSFCNMCQGR